MNAVAKSSIKGYIKEDKATPYTCAYLLSRILDEVTEASPDDLYLQSLFGWYFPADELKECEDIVEVIRKHTPDSLFKDDPETLKLVGNTYLFEYVYPDL